MGFVKGTDGIASTLRNTLEGYVGNIALENISAVTLTSTANVTGGNLITAGLISATSTITSSANVVGGNITTAGLITAGGNVTSGNVSVTGNVTGNTAGFTIGYRDIPQVSFAANATIATADAGKHFYSTSASNLILTIANNASQAFQTGSALTIINQGTGNITVAQGSGVTLYLAGNASAGNRTISTFGMATCIKVATDTWFINGTGVA